MANLQGGNVNVQGGTGISLGGPTGAGYQPQPAITSNILQSPGTIAVGNATKAVTQNQSYINTATNQYQSLLDRINALTSQLNKQVYAPPINIAGINAQARSMAENAVNPLYTKKLNDLLAEQAVEQSQAQKQHDISLNDVEQSLSTTLGADEVARQRAAEDAALNTGAINQTEQNTQENQGTAFDQERLNSARSIAASGLSTSGIGQGQEATAQEAHNTLESQQGQDFQTKRATEALTKARSFEDLATSDVLAGTKEASGKAQTEFDLNKTLSDISYNTQQSQNTLEGQRYVDISQQQQGYGKQLVNNFIASISDPALRAAAAGAYGSLF